MKILEHDRWGMVMEFCGTSLETIIASNHGQGLPRSLAQDVIASIGMAIYKKNAKFFSDDCTQTCLFLTMCVL